MPEYTWDFDLRVALEELANFSDELATQNTVQDKGFSGISSFSSPPLDKYPLDSLPSAGMKNIISCPAEGIAYPEVVEVDSISAGASAHAALGNGVLANSAKPAKTQTDGRVYAAKRSLKTAKTGVRDSSSDLQRWLYQLATVHSLHDLEQVVGDFGRGTWPLMERSAFSAAYTPFALRQLTDHPNRSSKLEELAALCWNKPSTFPPAK